MPVEKSPGPRSLMGAFTWSKPHIGPWGVFLPFERPVTAGGWLPCRRTEARRSIWRSELKIWGGGHTTNFPRSGSHLRLCNDVRIHRAVDFELSSDRVDG
jgi:hypothetical protein